jgi:hypothetical protein
VVNELFRIHFSAPALFYKTLSGLVLALQRVYPTEKAVPLYMLPEGLVRGRASCFPGLYGLSGVLDSLAML